MFLRETTKRMLEKSMGVSIAKLAKMDREQELSFIEALTGKKPSFSRTIDHRIAVRGNHAIAKKRIMTMDDVDCQILGWEKDERRY